MSTLFWWAVAAGATRAVFVLLVIMGLVSASRRGKFRPSLRNGRERAAQRFARGEIDADTYRVLRADLSRGARA